MNSIRSGQPGPLPRASHEPGTFDRPPQRVVSLVPSLTESIFELGLGGALVGITDYCIYPAEAVARLLRLGGPKNPSIDQITALQPDLVLANREENTPQVVSALQAAGLQVWVTFPQTARQAVEVLQQLAGIFQAPAAALRLRSLEMALDFATAALGDLTPLRYFCPIWYDTLASGEPWWMTFNEQTYAHDVLQIAGGENVFAARQRQYPLEADLGQVEADPAAAAGRDTRYPRVTLAEILALDPQVILLPSEPYAFDDAHLALLKQLLPDVQAVKDDRLHLVDGSLITWHGVRLGKALQTLPALFAG